jgi:hypothetical protein
VGGLVLLVRAGVLSASRGTGVRADKGTRGCEGDDWQAAAAVASPAGTGSTASASASVTSSPAKLNLVVCAGAEAGACGKVARVISAWGSQLASCMDTACTPVIQ